MTTAKNEVFIVSHNLPQVAESPDISRIKLFQNMGFM